MTRELLYRLGNFILDRMGALQTRDDQGRCSLTQEVHEALCVEWLSMCRLLDILEADPLTDAQTKSTLAMMKRNVGIIVESLFSPRLLASVYGAAAIKTNRTARTGAELAAAVGTEVEGKREALIRMTAIELSTVIDVKSCLEEIERRLGDYEPQVSEG